MPTFDLRQSIKESLHAFKAVKLKDSSLRLFKVLGYESEKTVSFRTNDAAGFKRFLKENSVDPINETKARTDEWKSVDFLFQLTDGEVQRTKKFFQSSTVDVSEQSIESYIFFAIELSGNEYSRTKLAEITREINKVFPMPAMVLFSHGETITLSLVDRRRNKKDGTRDVLGKVTLIKDIRLENTHRAHIDILEDLALANLDDPKTWVELHKEWQRVLDTKELNKKFFQELANWYFWAVETVEFPTGADKELVSAEHFNDEVKKREVRNATSVIRLITRLMFVWFLKEKGLVSENLFNEEYLKGVIKFSDDSAYYKAILQNLFFATLNSEMGTREFRKGSFQGKSNHYGVHNVFRYKSEFKEPEETLKELFEPIPFLNGGLFECLDKPDDNQRIDGFSDRDDNLLEVPDELFFGKEREIDLNEVYGTKKKKKYLVSGLINLLNGYKFTIAENTPIEEEIALDPELLGKVFENLLASYNPETKTTARKQTGSFYTPREIVNYMVDESLLAYLKQKLQTETEAFGFVALGDDQTTIFGNEGRVQQKLEVSLGNNSHFGKSDDEIEPHLRKLFAYDEDSHDFNEIEAEILIKAIDNCKILDPACGSGAFPMGILHRLVHLLSKLDPDNNKWREWQRQKALTETDEAYKIGDEKDRKERLDEIHKIFTENEDDYGRKLFLIENCIYGVDIQPIAIQIAKLRFFISLIVDQKASGSPPNNLGIRPLPNLETKFVAANTLIGLEAQGGLKPTKVDDLEMQLKEVRAKHFGARTRRTKEKYRSRDKEICLEIAALLKQGGIKADVADQIAGWNPYDQNASAGWFDAEYMFGIELGFDIVIGNPPYFSVSKLPELKLLKTTYQTYESTGDIYLLFYEKGTDILRSKGVLIFITSNKWLRANYGKSLRKYLSQNTNPIQLIDFGQTMIFESAIVHSNVLLIEKSTNTRKTRAVQFEEDLFKNNLSVFDYFDQNKITASHFGEDIWSIVPETNLKIQQKIEKTATPLKKWPIEFNRGNTNWTQRSFYY